MFYQKGKRNIVLAYHQMRTVHYYTQTFETDPTTHLPVASSLSALLQDPTMTATDSIVLYLSSVHFGTNRNATPYLHLNDTDVTALGPFFRDVERQCAKAVCKVQVRVMLGGAGGAYTVLFSDFDVYYALLHNFLRAYPWLCGVDLDVEEELDADPSQALICIQKLIRQLHTDFTDFTSPTKPFAITMAPVAYSLTGDSVGMGGFVYKDLLQSECGPMISQYNVQAYGNYDYSTYQSIIENGFDPQTIVFGMLGDEFAQATPFASAMTELQRITQAYPKHGGVILWEYGDTQIDGVVWGQAMRRAMTNAPTNMGDVGEEGDGEVVGAGCVVV